MSLGWMLSVGMIVRSVVKEKETRMKEVMRMMGLGRGQLWLSWFTTSFLTLLISVVIISLALSVSEYTLPLSLFPIFLYLDIIHFFLPLSLVWWFSLLFKWSDSLHISSPLFNPHHLLLVSIVTHVFIQYMYFT